MRTPDADTSATFLRLRLERGQPFFYLRYGDGALEAIYNMRPGSGTCDGEPYNKILGDRLLRSWLDLEIYKGDRAVYIGDWLTASFDGEPTHVDQWERLTSGMSWHGRKLHFEALLLMRESAALVEFYRAVRNHSGHKLYIGPKGNAGAARMLGAEHLVCPMGGLDAQWMEKAADDLRSRRFDVLLYGAGMAGCIPVIQCFLAHPQRTYIHLGSALDILFRGRSRRQQIPEDRARELFKELL